MRPAVEARRLTPRRRTTRTELHWAAGTGLRGAAAGGHEWAVAGQDLGNRDWVAINPVRLRKSAGVRHLYTPAMYFWQRTKSLVWCESQEERWEVLWLDYAGQVERLWSQPFALTFGHGTKLSGQSHYPDFLGQFADGTFGLFDERPAELIDDHARLQFAETSAVCEQLGWRYQVLSGHDKRATGNLECISASRHDRCRPTPQIESTILRAATNGRTRFDLCRTISPECPPLACAWVDNLAWRRLLDVNLGDVFDSETIYTTSPSALERTFSQ